MGTLKTFYCDRLLNLNKADTIQEETTSFCVQSNNQSTFNLISTTGESNNNTHKENYLKIQSRWVAAISAVLFASFSFLLYEWLPTQPIQP